METENYSGLTAALIIFNAIILFTVFILTIQL